MFKHILNISSILVHGNNNVKVRWECLYSVSSIGYKETEISGSVSQAYMPFHFSSPHLFIPSTILDQANVELSGSMSPIIYTENLGIAMEMRKDGLDSLQPECFKTNKLASMAHTAYLISINSSDNQPFICLFTTIYKR